MRYRVASEEREDSRRGHLTHLDDLVVETPTDYLHHLDQLRIADEE